MSNCLKYLSLIGVNAIYACIVIASKFASRQEAFSLLFFIGFGLTISVLGIYAILWQQLLKVTELSTACIFKGSSIVFVMLFAALFFKESISLNNIVGSLVIIAGIILFAKTDTKKPNDKVISETMTSLK